MVREVALLAQDALLEVLGAIGSMDHRGLMVSFKIEIVAVFKVFAYKRGNVANVSTDTDFERADLRDESDWVESIVRHAKWVKENVAKLKTLTSGEDLEAEAFFAKGVDPFGRLGIGENGNLELGGEDG